MKMARNSEMWIGFCRLRNLEPWQESRRACHQPVGGFQLAKQSPTPVRAWER